MSQTLIFRESSKVAQIDFIDSNLNLLAHAQTVELEIGSRCGGHGKCGGDRVQILDGSTVPLSALTEAEHKILTTDEIKKGYRLACQCFPNSNEGILLFAIFPNLQ